MANIVPFEVSKTLPAFLKDEQVTNNSDLLAHASTSFPVISIKGKAFAVVRDGVRQVLMNPRDPEIAATYIDVVITKVSPNTSKTFYLTAFKEGEDVKPACFSTDGKHPDAGAEQPQCKSCAACPHNRFGTAKNADGSPAKGKACTDFIRVAISDPNTVEDPMLLRVPPTSIRNLGEYGRKLDQHKVPYQAVLTRIGFVAGEAAQKLSFTPLGYLDEQTYRKVKEVAAGDIVDAMLNGRREAQEEPAEQEESAGDFIPQRVVTTANGTVAPSPVVPPVVNDDGTTKTAEVRADDLIEAAIAKTASNAKPPVTVVEKADKLAEQLEGLNFD